MGCIGLVGSKFFNFHGNNGVMSTNGPGKIRTSFSPHHTNCSRNEPLTGSSAIFINGFSRMWQSFTTYLGTPFLRAWLSPALLLPTGFHASLSGPKAREKMVDVTGNAPVCFFSLRVRRPLYAVPTPKWRSAWVSHPLSMD